MKNIFKRIFGKKEEPKEEQDVADHDMVADYIDNDRPVILLQENVNGKIRLRLYMVAGVLFTRYLIQLGYLGEPKEYLVKVFWDTDTEYAENCAREAFEYLTKEI